MCLKFRSQYSETLDKKTNILKSKEEKSRSMEMKNTLALNHWQDKRDGEITKRWMSETLTRRRRREIYVNKFSVSNYEL